MKLLIQLGNEFCPLGQYANQLLFCRHSTTSSFQPSSDYVSGWELMHSQFVVRHDHSSGICRCSATMSLQLSSKIISERVSAILVY